jgi:hypothetical protein
MARLSSSRYGVVVVVFVGAATVDAVDVTAAALAGLSTLEFVLFIALWGDK